MSKYKTRQQIADEYGISARTLDRKLKCLEILLPPGLIDPKTQELIRAAMDCPTLSSFVQSSPGLSNFRGK